METDELDPRTSLPTEDEVGKVDGLTEMGVYETKVGQVKFFGRKGKPLVETDEWKLFAAKLPSGQLGLFMIAATPETNDVIEWQDFIVTTMQGVADSVDSKAPSPEFAPNYGAFFPKPIDTIDAGGRVALVLGYHPIVSAYRELKPLSTIPADKRIDLKTAMWILGKSLKLATLFHSLDCSIGNVSADNVFITMDNLDIHGVFYLDFTFAFDIATSTELKAELSEMAKTAWYAAGGSDTMEPPYDSDILTPEGHAEFVGNLKRMKNGDVANVATEMDRLYEINDRVWPKIPIEGGPNSRGQTHKRQWHIFNLRNR
jgi:hypothetical protein